MSSTVNSRKRLRKEEMDQLYQQLKDVRHKEDELVEKIRKLSKEEEEEEKEERRAKGNEAPPTESSESDDSYYDSYERDAKNWTRYA